MVAEKKYPLNVVLIPTYGIQIAVVPKERHEVLRN
jgi:hypothetical protein